MTLSTRRWLVRGRNFFRSLTGQLMLLILAALLLAMVVNLWVLSSAHRNSLFLAHQDYVVRQYASFVQLLEQLSPPLRKQVVRAWRRPGWNYGFAGESTVPKADSPEELRMQRSLAASLGNAYQGKIRINFKIIEKKDWRDDRKSDDRDRGGRDEDADRGPPPEDDRPRRERRILFDQLSIAVQLDDGVWFWSDLSSPKIAPLTALHTISYLFIACALVLIVVFWQMRRITQPLRHLASAASALGRGQKVAPLKEEGPMDIRQTVVAFNQMNERINRFVSDRTRLLAALSHDLRTPLTSMRLRLELMDESDERDRLISSLDEMQEMSEATLSFIRNTGDTESYQSVDMAALLDSLCEDLVELSMPVAFQSSEPAIMRCRPVSIKRALRNLLENAVRYGQVAQVFLQSSDDHLIVTVKDEGPGIPESQMDAVFDPFFRLESSRNRATGGMGLGLSIARQIVIAHGGEIRLRNLNPGLEVKVILPLG